ncbi:MAG: DUF2283 domain-containing protein [Candidatus Bathyarchaeia archaeon]
MKVEYSPDVDAMVITLDEGRPKFGKEVGEGIIIHYSEEEKPIEIEILDARAILFSFLDAVIQKARKGKPPSITPQ